MKVSDTAALDLRDPKFDVQKTTPRTEILLQLLREQAAYSIARSPFWRERFDRASLNPVEIRDYADWRRLPPLQKSEMRKLGPWGLVPESAHTQVRVTRTTSGSTGQPTTTMWTGDDWRALTLSVARMLASHKPVDRIVAFNGYHQGHLAGPLYDDAINCLGGISLPRSHVEEEKWPTAQQIKEYGCNTLILAEGPATAKTGVAMRDIIDYDAETIAACGARWWIGSSGTFSADVMDRAGELGIKAITNLLGCSEFGLMAVSCPAHWGHFHLAEGHVLVELLDSSSQPVSDGERGRLIVSSLCGVDQTGVPVPRQGTQLLRLDIGNEATVYLDECECGLTTARISEITRL